MQNLRQECAELRLSNASLEHHLRDGANGRHSPPIAPGSPLLRATKSPFLTPPLSTNVPAFAANYNPSPLGDHALSVGFPFARSREIPGFYVVIPAGGAGTRLWPLSRENHPKFLLDLTLKGRSLIQATWDRLIPLSSPSRTTVVAGPSHVKTIRDQLPELGVDNIFTEPGPKDSMAAIGLAAAILAKRDPNAIIGSFAADHMISGDDAFLSAVSEAVEVAKKDFLVTIGIAPSYPSTGFGYIRLGKSVGIAEAPNALMVDSFKEKPDAKTASNYLTTGKYRWNAGMFVTKATVLLELLEQYKPELAAGLAKIGEAWDDPVSREKVLAEVWPTLEKIPIDNAVAEPAAADNKVAVVPATFGWDDVGDFSSLSDLLPAEQNQPKILGDNNLGMFLPALGHGHLMMLGSFDDPGVWWDCRSRLWASHYVSGHRRFGRCGYAGHAPRHDPSAVAGSEVACKKSA